MERNEILGGAHSIHKCGGVDIFEVKLQKLPLIKLKAAPMDDIIGNPPEPYEVKQVPGEIILR